MPDITRHSKGMWRTFFIFSKSEEQFRIAEVVSQELESKNLMFSYCHYCGSKDEEDHISFRINFSATPEYEEFCSFLDSQNYRYESTNYDEEYWVKIAYVLGTRLAREVSKEKQKGEWTITPNFYRLMFHGFFNDMNWDYSDETSFYLYLLRSFLVSKFGFRDMR